MKVSINPLPHERQCGLSSFASWENPDLQAALRAMFRIDPRREKLEAIEIDRDGITVRMSHVPNADSQAAGDGK